MTKTNWQNKFFKISIALNVIIMNVFLTLNTLTNLGNRNLGLTASYFAIFSILMVLANYVVYLFYKKEKWNH